MRSVFEGGEGVIRGGKSDKSNASGVLGPFEDRLDERDIAGGVVTPEDMSDIRVVVDDVLQNTNSTAVKEVSALIAARTDVKDDASGEGEHSLDSRTVIPRDNAPIPHSGRRTHCLPMSLFCGAASACTISQQTCSDKATVSFADKLRVCGAQFMTLSSS